MAKKTETICDGCGEICEHYFDFKDVEIISANGKRADGTHMGTMGHALFKIENVQLCSLRCIGHYFDYKMPCKNEERKYHYLPGDQVGLKCAGEKKILGK